MGLACLSIFFEKIDLSKFNKKLVLLYWVSIFFPKSSEALLIKGNINKG